MTNTADLHLTEVFSIEPQAGQEPVRILRDAAGVLTITAGEAPPAPITPAGVFRELARALTGDKAIFSPEPEQSRFFLAVAGQLDRPPLV